MGNELLPNKEKEVKPEIVHRFFEMNAKEERVLKERIKKFEGLVRVFIHPDFEKYANFEDIKKDPKDVEKLQNAAIVFKRIISSKSEKLPPVFIFESGAEIDEFKKEEDVFREIGGNDLYIIRTELANSSPLSPDRENNYRWNFFEKIPNEEKEQMWQWLIEEFKNLGIKKILIGGLEFYVSKDKDIGHGGCLGEAIKRLEKFFDVQVATLTWPDDRKEITGIAE